MSYLYTIKDLTSSEMVAIKHVLRMHHYLAESNKEIGQYITPTVEELAVEGMNLADVIDAKTDWSVSRAVESPD